MSWKEYQDKCQIICIIKESGNVYRPLPQSKVGQQRRFGVRIAIVKAIKHRTYSSRHICI